LNKKEAVQAVKYLASRMLSLLSSYSRPFRMLGMMGRSLLCIRTFLPHKITGMHSQTPVSKGYITTQPCHCAACNAKKRCTSAPLVQSLRHKTCHCGNIYGRSYTYPVSGMADSDRQQSPFHECTLYQVLPILIDSAALSMNGL
jgi:hypothetical protein